MEQTQVVQVPTGRMMVNGFEVRFMPPEALFITRPLHYIDSFSIYPLMKGLAQDPVTRDFDPPNMLLRGPKGVGKTLLFMHWAKEEQLPYISLNCSLETKDRYTKGGWVALPGGGMVYVLGKLSNAVLVANMTGAAMLVFEELNAMPPEQQKNLNSLTDFRQEVEIPELGWNLTLQPDASLLIGGTMNNAGGGIYELNEDLQSRFLQFDLGYPDTATEMAILKSARDGIGLSDDILEMLIRIAQQTRQGSTTYALSPRDLLQVVQALKRVGWHEALFLISQKFPPEDRKLVLERIKDITTATVPESVVDRSKIVRGVP